MTAKIYWAPRQTGYCVPQLAPPGAAPGCCALL